MKTSDKKTNTARRARRNSSNGNGHPASARGNGNGAAAASGRQVQRGAQPVIQVRRQSSKGSFGVGIIGCGYWGPNLVRNLNALGDCTVRWLCDLNPKRLQHMSSLYSSLKTTGNFQREAILAAS